VLSERETWPAGNLRSSQLNEHRGIVNPACIIKAISKRSHSFIDSQVKWSYQSVFLESTLGIFIVLAMDILCQTLCVPYTDMDDFPSLFVH
jgi:hypothetical protein